MKTGLTNIALPFIAVAIVLRGGPIEGFQTQRAVRHRHEAPNASLTRSKAPTTIITANVGHAISRPARSTKSPLFFASVTADDSGDDSTTATEWTKPRLHNTATFRSLAILSALALAGYSSSPQKILSSQALAALHLLSFATWFGSVAYTTFIAGITMFKNLPRQTFGKLQAKLFPKYFMLGSVTLVLQLVTLSSLSTAAIKISSKSIKALGIALAMTLGNQFYLEPVSTHNMMRRYELENSGGQETDEYKGLKKNFGKFHGMSSLTNLIALCGGVAHAVYLSRALVGA